MKKRYVLPASVFPSRPPGMLTAFLWMAMDYYKSPGWLQGVVWTLMVILWLVFFSSIWTEEVKPLPGHGERESK